MKITIRLSLILFYLAGSARGSYLKGEGALPATTNSFRILLENDMMFGKTDRFYTNGIRIEAARNDYHNGEAKVPTFLLKNLFRRVDRGEATRGSHGYVAGQNMYTPTDIHYGDVLYGDRPYAGWLYGGTSWILGSKKTLQSLEVDLGVVGVASRAKEAQIMVHKGIDNVIPEGWKTQVNGKSGLQLKYDVLRARYWNRFVQTGYTVNVTAGNVFTSIGTGGMLKFGFLDPQRADLALYPLPPSIPSAVPATFKTAASRELYVFVKPEVTASGYNALLEGSGNGVFVSPESGAGELLSYRLLAGSGATLSDYYFLIQEPRLTNRFFRYRLFQNAFPSSRAYGIDYLVFNTLFNGSRQIPAEDLLPVIHSLFTTLSSYTDPGDRYFLYRSVFHEPGSPIDPLSKALAYRILTRGSSPQDPVAEWMVYRTLFEKIPSGRHYAVKRIPFVGTLRTGVAFDTRHLSVSVTMGLRTREFEANDRIPTYHKWGQIQCAVTF